MTTLSNTLRIHTISLGCPKNRVDTEVMLGTMLSSIQAVDTPEQADVVLVNTCGFIEPAVQESVQTILETADAIADLNPKPLLVVTGCLVMRYEQELRQELPEVDLFVTIPQQKELPALLKQALHRNIPNERSRALSTSPGYGYLKISEGCDNACRFCTIPSLRGPLRSQPVDTIVNQAKHLLSQGVKELVVIAQDVTAYGKDLGMQHGLETLLERVLPLDGLEWLRLMYLYPAGLTNERLAFLASCGKPLVPYLDIPFQHSHPDILRTMGRPFMHDPLEIVSRIRTHMPDAAIRTTMIVGYPGETNAHFQHLVQTVQAIRFTHMGVFTFFPEEGTPAAAMKGQVDQTVKEDRKTRLMEIQAEISRENLCAYADTLQPVLVDEPCPEWEGLFTGRTWFQAPEVDGVTYVSGPGVEPGKLVQARIHETKTYDLVGLVE
ncbi:30S ribosomal protein S12 methylthiotransferase RimO [Desulfoplanes formicivorans]|uniref:Ribosomal protein uS12 methylthiotransferase RimO n=1 Tax=Desulfoplanes formicivorans TaxID=1592317 RepID=A0A194AIZ8_9BACT|nr:30S ribosomal protein S12 methylthiotransferase RimO [Desulfoplanes formicivorans]GAU08719.1 ribosomal protein S12 methylthiotransferase RimO [Desulfoplanes formicivorans]